MSAISNILAAFEAISLVEMKKVKLQNRTDVKFMFPASKLPELLACLKTDYFYLKLNASEGVAYHSVYYDTHNLNLYLQHHNGALNRYKVRHRTYADSGLTFLELKFKSNKARTIKTRIKAPLLVNGFDETAAKFLKENLPFDYTELNPKVHIQYKRVTLVSKTNTERVTLDLDLQFYNGKHALTLQNLIIAEVKQEHKQPSIFLNAMKNRNIREASISKYCLALALTNPLIKQNNFKENLRTINTIIYDESVTN